MKRLIIHSGFVFVGLVLCSIFLIVEISAYKRQPDVPVVCNFVQWEKSDHLRMKLKCGDKEYKSVDVDLILQHPKNPDKEITGMVDKYGYVTTMEKKK